MKRAIAVMLVIIALPLCAQTHPANTGNQWQPSPGHKQIPIWPGKIPDARPITGPETVVPSGKELVAGKPYLYINDVSRPTLTVYPPKGENRGVGVIVFPGGGYQILAIDIEGTESCDWLTSRGITCILSKYRVPGQNVLPKSGAYPAAREALDDAQRTVSLMRFHAAEWHLDPHKIGVLGFSAGGHLAAALSVHFGQRIYSPVDAADEVSCRPDFAIAIYPGHLSEERGTIRLVPDIRDHITAQTPPTFLLQNEDDHIDSVEDSLSYFFALKKTGVPVELHVYAQGGHAFGLRATNLPATHWPALAETWLHTIGVLR